MLAELVVVLELEETEVKPVTVRWAVMAEMVVMAATLPQVALYQQLTQPQKQMIVISKLVMVNAMSVSTT